MASVISVSDDGIDTTASGASGVELDASAATKADEKPTSSPPLDVSLFKVPTKAVTNKALVKPFHPFPDRKSVGDDRTYRQIVKSFAAINAMHIFDQWDYKNSGFLSLHEFQAGLLNAGVLLDATLILASMNRVCLRGKHENLVSAQEFVPFFLTMCGEDAEDMQAYLVKLKDAIPESAYGQSKFLDSHNPHVQQFLKRHHTEVRRKSTHSEAPGATNTSSSMKLEEIEELSESDWTQNWDFWTPRGMWEIVTFQRGVAPAFVCFILWEFGFALFYHLYTGFRFDRAYYYSAQAGLSVGFGSLSEEIYGGMEFYDENGTVTNREWTSSDYDVSKAFTIVNVLLGSSVIGGALGYFVDKTLKNHEDWYAQMIEAHQRGERLEKLEKSGNEAEYGYERMIVFYEDNLMEVRLCLIVFVFIFVGMLFGMLNQEWTFITSLYYCITAMSTAGLQGPNPEHSLAMWFTGTYVLFGVPLYGACLGIFADKLIERNLEKSEDEHFNKVITANECVYFSKLVSKKDDMDSDVAIDNLTEIEFLELELVRTGKCDPEFVDEARAAFRKFDAEDTGFVTWTEIVASNLFKQYYEAPEGYDGIELMTIGHFQQCCEDLAKAPYRLVNSEHVSRSALQQVFTRCVNSHVHAGMTRTQFCYFVEAIMAGMTDVSQFDGTKPKKKTSAKICHA